MPSSDETDGIFETGSIFANRELLRVGHVPDLERVVGRDDEVSAIGSALGPATVVTSRTNRSELIGTGEIVTIPSGC